jgi:putative hydrolase of the HAD superfamily
MEIDLKLFKHLDVDPAHFTMIGNSLKSDILPVLAVGGHGIHVPYHTTWAHEVVSYKVENQNFREVEELREVLQYLD